MRALAAGFVATILLGAPAVAADPTAAPTFHSLGLTWDPSGGAADVDCTPRYRRLGTSQWRDGYPLWFDGRDSEYRGSLVHLFSGTPYEIELSLEGGETASLIAATWHERFPIGQTHELPESSASTLVIEESGSAQGYILYTHVPGTTATLDAADAQDYNITIDASYVVVRGLALKNARQSAIRINGASHDVVIEECDISGWGRIDTDGWGVNRDAAVKSTSTEIERIIVQRNTIHHPRSDSNNWDENRVEYDSYHPRGAQAVDFTNSRGNHVIRYNNIFSDDDHRYNDVLGAGSNFSWEGFPNRDSDIYGNHISHCWDDGIEAEGANRNVRIWGNFIEKTYVKIATASTSVGPMYIWRNVAGQARKSFVEPWDDTSRGGFLKTSDGAHVTGEPGGGIIYVFHNTLLQPDPPAGSTYPIGCDPGLGHGGPMLNVTTRNNILHVSKDWHASITDRNHDPLADYDYDLYNGDIDAEAGAESNGIVGVPEYDPGNGEGEYALASSSPGFDAGQTLPGFNYGFAGLAPDIGAFEAGSPPMEFGVDAYRNAPPTADPGPDRVVVDQDNNGIEQILLDGSASHDPDGYIATWSWSEAGTDLGSGESLTIDLAIGEHVVTLTVTDNLGDTHAATTRIDVTSPTGDGHIPGDGHVANGGDADNGGPGITTGTCGCTTGARGAAWLVILAAACWGWRQRRPG
ncbi:hypothetical protein ACFL6C_04665 [Myxococcota bacterium]